MNLRGLLEQAAAALPDVGVVTALDGGRTWSRGGIPFTVLTGDGIAAEFALDGAVAAAASRTPDVTPSPRGVGWVFFRPAVLDDHAADRATAWFTSAHRRLARG